MQLTALGNPKLLERTSAGLKAIEGLFADFDLNKDHSISHEEFNQVWFILRYSELSAAFLCVCRLAQTSQDAQRCTA